MSTTHDQSLTSTGTSGMVARGLILFAAIMLSVAGVWQIVMGIAAVAKDTVFASLGDYVFKLDLTTWGWVHIVLGVALLLIGICLMLGQSWARWGATAAAGISLIVNFAWLPWSPLWAVLVIALDCMVIWALLSRADVVDVR